MRPGKVTTIRVNPKDCLAVLDVCKMAGVDIPGASFASLVSLALSSLLQTVRDNKLIPERDGFEYSEMMAPYLDRQYNNARKSAVSEAIHKAGSDIHLRGLSRPANDPPFIPEAPKPTKKTGGLELRQAQSRLSELLQKKELAEAGNTGIVWGSGDQDEFDKCYAIVYPEG